MIFTFFLIAYSESPSGILFQALSDELNRNISELWLEGQEKPYYLSFRVLDSKGIEIKASLGGLLYSNDFQDRHLYVDLRVGGYQLDNSNFVCEASGFSVIESYETSLPIEDDYFALRQAIWLVTDGTYKRALDKIARKRAYLKNRETTDTIFDFCVVKPYEIIEPIPKLDFNKTKLNQTVVGISRIVQNLPSVFESSVILKGNVSVQYFLDSEGAKSVRADKFYTLDIQAKARGQDGEIIEDFIGFYTKNGELDFAEIEKNLHPWAETLLLKTKLGKTEGYSGPVLFLGQASCELFFQILGKGVSDVRQPIFESEMLKRNIVKQNLGILSGRLGKKVTPNFISVFDDPNMKNYEGIPLLGSFSVDDQGVRAERVELVKEGKLVGLLMSRAPTDKIKASNGHARYANETYGPRYIGFVGNLIIGSTKRVSDSELFTKFKELIRDYGNSYGIVITKLEPTRVESERARYQRLYNLPNKSIPLLSPPINVYKMDLNTGALELIKGFEFSQVTPRILRDIVVTGEKDFVYNFIYNDPYGNKFPVSVVAPAVLIEEVDLIPGETKTTRAPFLSRP